FFGTDRTFTLAADFGPCSFRDDGPGKPTEIESQVVKSAEIMCGTVTVGVNDCEDVGCGGLDERLISNGMVCFASKSSGASFLCCRNSVRGQFIHQSLPCSLRHSWFVCCEVGPSEVEVESWLPVRFIHRVQQSFGFASVARAKRSLLR